MAGKLVALAQTPLADMARQDRARVRQDPLQVRMAAMVANQPVQGQPVTVLVATAVVPMAATAARMAPQTLLRQIKLRQAAQVVPIQHHAVQAEVCARNR